MHTRGKIRGPEELIMESTTAGIYPVDVITRATALDSSRCDRCGAAARVLVSLSRNQLTFCGHHWHRYEAQLIKDGWAVQASSLDQLTTS